MIKVEPAEDHRRRHRLALPERAQTRAEGVRGRTKGRASRCAMMQTRRRFLTTLSLAGAAGLVRAQPALAEEGALETTTVRIVKSTQLFASLRRYVAEELLRAEGFTDIRYVSVPSEAAAAPTCMASIDARRFRLYYRTLRRCASTRSIRVWRSRSWPACMSAASNCSRMRRSAASPI